MKRIVVLVMGILLLVSGFALGEEIDVDSMTTAELVVQYETIRNELLQRLDESTLDSSIARGQYIVGVDIAPGKYEFICTEAIVEGDHEYPYISVYKIIKPEEFEKRLSYAWYDATEERYYSKRLQVGSKVSFTLEEGMILVIERCAGIIQLSNHSWGP